MLEGLSSSVFSRLLNFRLSGLFIIISAFICLLFSVIVSGHLASFFNYDTRKCHKLRSAFSINPNAHFRISNRIPVLEVNTRNVINFKCQGNTLFNSQINNLSSFHSKVSLH